MQISLLFAVVAAGLVKAAPTSTFQPALDPRQDAGTCPGYVASNVQTTGSSIAADLKLAGAPCNRYSPDLEELKLLVEYQTGKSRLFMAKYPPLYLTQLHLISHILTSL